MLHLGDEVEIPTSEITEEPSTELAEPPQRHESDELMDAVFAMLGADAGLQATTNSEAMELPWILCIDDDFDFSDALKLRFDEYGVAVARAANGMDGFRMAFSTPARAILLDYQMPNGQGDYILDRLKSNPVTRDIPVYMITGYKDKMLERRVMAMGAAGYLLKPVDFELLRSELSRYISALEPRARRTPLAASVR
jgi:CheY-like chemotaxis protein